MKRSLSEYAIWFAVGLVAGCIWCGVLHAQTTTQPTTQPLGQVTVWAPGTPIVTGGRYVLPWRQPVNITVNVPGVSFYGGWVWAESGSCITVNRGGTGCTIVGARFDKPGVPRDGRKLAGFKDCVITYAADTHVLFCQVGTVDEFVKALPGSTGLLVDSCEDVAGDIRSAWVYLAGAKDPVVRRCTFRDSRTENGIRTSPQGDAVSENVLLEDNDLANPGDKMAVDARHVRGITIRHNWIRNGARYADGSIIPAIKLGDSDAPGASGIVFEDNDVLGQVHAKSLSQGVCRGNRIHGCSQLTDVPLNFDNGLDGRGNQVRPATRVEPIDNVAYNAGPNGFKPVITRSGLPLPGSGNRWEPAPATQPIP